VFAARSVRHRPASLRVFTRAVYYLVTYIDVNMCISKPNDNDIDMTVMLQGPIAREANGNLLLMSNNMAACVLIKESF
jgi:hypothetical protein